MNLNNLTSVVSKANKLNSYMTAGRVLQIQDKMDVIYISQIIEKFSKQVFKYPQVSHTDRQTGTQTDSHTNTQTARHTVLY